MDIEENTGNVQLLTALTPIIERLQRIARNDPVVRAELRRLGEALLAFSTEPQVTEPTVETGLPELPVLVTTAAIPLSTGIASLPEAPTIEAVHIEPITEIQTADVPTATPLVTALPTGVPSRSSTTKPPARARQPQQTSKTHTTAKHSQSWVAQRSVQLHGAEQSLASGVSAFDLSALAQRCAIKKEGATWAAARQQRLAQGIKNDLQLESYRQQLILHAQSLPDCHLWMCQREAPPLATTVQFEHVVGCFAVMMDTADLLHALLSESEEQSPFLEEALNLAAQAQATLHKAVAAIYGTPDDDQTQLFQWLKDITVLYHIQLRYMTKRNAADPAAWSTLQARIRALARKIQAVKQGTKQRKRLMGEIQRHCKVIRNYKGTKRLDDWQRLAVAVTELIETGLPPSNVELRKHLLPVIDDLPETLDLSKNFYLVLRELDRFLAKRPASAAKKAANRAGMSPIEEVQRVRVLLRGRVVLIIGGERRPSAVDALTLAFGLKELIWIESYEKTHINFEPYVARADIAVVILAIRWIPHSYGEVKEFCEQYDKPLVRLLAGYNPNQVAYTILNQVSHQLEAKTDSRNESR